MGEPTINGAGVDPPDVDITLTTASGKTHKRAVAVNATPASGFAAPEYPPIRGDGPETPVGRITTHCGSTSTTAAERYSGADGMIGITGVAGVAADDETGRNAESDSTAICNSERDR